MFPASTYSSSRLWVRVWGLSFFALSVVPVVSGLSELHSPCASDLASLPPTPPRECRVGGHVERRLELLLQENSLRCHQVSFSV